MNDDRIVFDAAIAHREFLTSSQDIRYLFIGAVIIFAVAAIFVFVARRQPKTVWSFTNNSIAAVFAVLGVWLSVMVWASIGQSGRQEQLESWIKQGDFETLRGTISESVLIVGRKKADAIPTFRVGEHVFQFSANSQNSLLHHHGVGGVIRDGLLVEIHHRNGLILQILRLEDEYQ